jgi:hypothetical protein
LIDDLPLFSLQFDYLRVTDVVVLAQIIKF